MGNEPEKRTECHAKCSVVVGECWLTGNGYCAAVAYAGSVPDSLADENGMVILNPSAIGNPDETPQVWVGADLMALLNPCRVILPDAVWCGGVNGYHRDGCPSDSSGGVR